MRNALRIILIILVVAGLGVGARLVVGTHEPSYKGKSVSYWVDPWARGGHETLAERSSALAAMSDRAVPYLVARLQWRPSPMIRGLQRRFPNFTLLIGYEQGRWDLRGQAAHDLGEFGSLASNAIPDLIVTSTNIDLGSSWYPRLCAKAALIKIKHEDLGPYIAKLKDTSALGFSSLENWYQNALMIGEFGTNAAAAVPNLILALGPTNNPVIQAHALIALGEIHSRPEISVPAMIPFMRSPDMALKEKAVVALGQFREAGKPAWKGLSQCLSDSEGWLRRDAVDSLRNIDPAEADKEGVK